MAINNSTYGTELDESYDMEVVKKYRDSSCGNSQPIYNTYRFREETPEKKDVPTNMNLREYYLQKMKDEMYR